LHLAVDAETGEIVAHVLTDKNGGDITQVPALLATVEGRIASVIADGAYDSEAVYREAASYQHDPPVDVVIPPRSSSVATADAESQTIRDCHVQHIAQNGRMAWQKETGYGRRSLAERRSAATSTSLVRRYVRAQPTDKPAKPPSPSRFSTARSASLSQSPPASTDRTGRRGQARPLSDPCNNAIEENKPC
jgi:hypothetical protein